MAHALPVTKLAGLLLKTLAKPVAKRIKHEASRRPLTRQMLVGIGQFSHQFTSRLTIWSAGYKVRSITQLEEEKALSTGSEFLSESFLLIVSGGIVIWEYNRSKASEQKKTEQHRAAAKAERMALQAKLHALDVRVKALEVVVKQSSESILNIGGARYVAPKDTVPIDDVDDDDDDTGSAQSAKEPEKSKEPQGSSVVVERIHKIFPKSKSTPSSETTIQQSPPSQEQPESSLNKSIQEQPNGSIVASEPSATASAPEAATTKPWWQFW